MHLCVSACVNNLYSAPNIALQINAWDNADEVSQSKHIQSNILKPRWIQKKFTEVFAYITVAQEFGVRRNR